MTTKTSAAPAALRVDLTPSPKAEQGISLLSQAQGLTVTDKDSHEAALTFRKDANTIKKDILEYYAKMKRPLNEARSVILDFEKRHVEPIDRAIALADNVIVGYVREQQRKEQEAADKLRRQAEADAELARNRELAEMERQRAALEESAEALSERETVMVRAFVASDRSATSAARAAKLAGYTDITAAVKRLQSPKLSAAIVAMEKAAALAEQAKVVAATPVVVEAPVVVESAIGSVAGTSLRNYYGCDPNVDLQILMRAVLDGRVTITAIQPNMTYLNAEARNLKELFPQAFPGCALTKRQGIAG